eukprot:Nk52_evm40s296 gene=Nk52_evmTU40s296
MAIDLYSLATPNGQKVAIALEEMGLPYEAHTVNIMKGEQFAPDFLKVCPNGKIPAIRDSDGPGGKPISVWDSCSILLYLADKTGKLISKDPAERTETITWLFFQSSGQGPMMGQFNHFFKYAPDKIPYAMERYRKESIRLLKVLDDHLEGKQYMVGETYSIADIALFTWVSMGFTMEHATKELELQSFPNLLRWSEKISERDAVKRGKQVTPFQK